jgi:hypothetical protein
MWVLGNNEPSMSEKAVTDTQTVTMRNGLTDIVETPI